MGGALGGIFVDSSRFRTRGHRRPARRGDPLL